MTDVLVLHAALPGRLAAERECYLLDRLPYARRLELERRDEAARAASLLALELLADGVAHMRGGSLDMTCLRYPADGKPLLEGGPWFSTTHSRTRVAVALSDLCELGVDVEDLDPARADRAALERWTAIEATLKAVGAGLRQAHDVRLATDLATAELPGRLVYTRSILLDPGCVARLATCAPAASVVVEEWGEATGNRG